MNTSFVNISEAAKLAGISRTYLYKKYINTGIMSVSMDKNGNKVIDVSEIVRVFGKIVDVNEDVNQFPRVDIEKNMLLQNQIEALQEQLRAKDAVIEAQKANLEDLRQSMMLIEYKNNPKSWYQFWK